MFRNLLLPTVAAVFLVVPTAGQAAKVKVWHHNTPTQFEKARLKHAVISNEGALRLSRQLKPLTALEATHVWDVVEDKAGNLFAATGDEGKIYKITPDGKASVVFTSEDSQVLCLALAADGSLYAGTGPSGLVLRISPDGSGKVLYKSPEKYIWCLAITPDGQTVYAGTGPKGHIYEVAADGKAHIFYSTKQEHILSLALGGDGTLYAGTDKNGVVYRIDSKGKGFVLYSTPQTEVRSLLVTADGVYAGTSSPTRRRPGMPATPGSSNPLMPATPRVPGAPASTDAKKTSTEVDGSGAGLSPGGTTTSVDPFEKSNPAPSNPPPIVGENSLYRIAPDGTVRELFREKTLLLSLLRQNGHIFIGTGIDGQLFEVDEATKERSEIARLDHGQIHALCRRQDGSIVLATGDPGRLYVLQEKYAPTGTVLSEVLDAKLISKWGSLRWKADTPPGTCVTVAVRSGNTSEPDETWSNWSAEQTDPQQAVIAAPTARFLQYRLTLTTKDPAQTPALHSLALRYMTTNQAPEVSSIQVPDLDAVNLENPKKVRFKWSATDPNEDDLSYALYIRKDGWKNWVELEENLERTEYEWDTTTTPSGMYQIKVVASDRKDNPTEDSLTGERISSPFAVAHDPPAVTLKTTDMDGEQAIIEATATDPMVRLTAATYSVNGKKWINVFPTDGLFDSKTETFRFKTEALKPGTYVVVLRVRDAAGNVGSGDVVFSVKAK
jgi:sugar lactone lactonase YvrE